ncbi:TetR/AcrR family transcriptional regulator C-terminal domain-containing protein [Streptacidiphilus cavernicola]|uniref:TetR/AcrR family transcriptional regulator C-terminal domain-containing protein n=1 Tax=Streptacidiphilus cavernicola TaxID=3342716 RepID=A0ABV6UPL3_9ACTN
MSRQQSSAGSAPAGSAASQTPPARRGRGNSVGLGPKQIVDAARTLPPERLTMQAVANLLGVDRKAIHNHVPDREALATLVALDALAANSTDVQIPEDADWQTASRIYAYGLVDGVIAVGGLARHLSQGSPLTAQTLDGTEAVLARLIEAGFDQATAQRYMAALTNICLAFARDVIDAAQEGTATRLHYLQAALAERDADHFPHLSRIARQPEDTYDRQQLEFTLDIFLAGAAAADPDPR